MYRVIITLITYQGGVFMNDKCGWKYKVDFKILSGFFAFFIG